MFVNVKKKEKIVLNWFDKIGLSEDGIKLLQQMRVHSAMDIVCHAPVYWRERGMNYADIVAIFNLLRDNYKFELRLHELNTRGLNFQSFLCERGWSMREIARTCQKNVYVIYEDDESVSKFAQDSARIARAIASFRNRFQNKRR